MLDNFKTMYCLSWLWDKILLCCFKSFFRFQPRALIIMSSVLHNITWTKEYGTSLHYTQTYSVKSLSGVPISTYNKECWKLYIHLKHKQQISCIVLYLLTTVGAILECYLREVSVNVWVIQIQLLGRVISKDPGEHRILQITSMSFRDNLSTQVWSRMIPNGVTLQD